MLRFWKQFVEKYLLLPKYLTSKVFYCFKYSRKFRKSFLMCCRCCCCCCCSCCYCCSSQSCVLTAVASSFSCLLLFCAVKRKIRLVLKLYRFWSFFKHTIWLHFRRTHLVVLVVVTIAVSTSSVSVAVATAALALALAIAITSNACFSLFFRFSSSRCQFHAKL